MATKRKPIRTSNNLNFRPGGPDVSRGEAKGTRPTAPPTSIKEILIMMILHVCKKTIFFDTNLKVALYLGSLFLVSLIGDFIPFPKSYFARSDNLFNQYFVKVGWGWTLLFAMPFMIMTAYTLCCGDMQKLLKHHFPRLAVATFFWFFWTKMFNIIETTYGRCTVKAFASKSSCLRAGHLWNGFDISGHAFILIHSSLVLIEEARPIVKWETIKEHLRNELYDRSIDEHTGANPLRYLNTDQMKNLKFLYTRLTPLIRTLFIGMTALQLLWDVMLVGTMLYYHNMIEKVLSGIIAICTWYFTYRFWYRSPAMLPDSPGSGDFLYQRESKDVFAFNRRKQSTTMTGGGMQNGASTSAAARNAAQSNAAPAGASMPTFMGMPIYTARSSGGNGNQMTKTNFT